MGGCQRCRLCLLRGTRPDHKARVFDGIDRPHGEFDINRLWYGALYYFFPIWTIIRSDGQFLFSEFETGTFNGVELPPSSFLLSDPLLLILGGAAVLKLPQLRRGRLLDLRAV